MTTALVPDTLPTITLRTEDSDLIEEWLEARAGIAPEPLSDYVIYEDNNRMPAKDWGVHTIRIARQKMQALATRMPVPLRQVGLRADGSFSPESVRAPILAFARDFEVRSRPRIQKILESLGAEVRRLKGPLIWRTKAWWYQVTYGKEFYNWLERQGRRPRGSNPFQGVNRPTPATIKRTVLKHEWFEQVLTSPLTPKKEAVLFLLANGLRCEEICTLKMRDLDMKKFPSGEVTVLGKGAKLRVIPMYRRTAIAIKRYLRARENDPRTTLFPAPQRDAPCTVGAIQKLVEKVVRRVIEDPEVRPRVTPHKFRHYFASDFMDRGGKAVYAKALMGHTSYQMLEKYTHSDPKWLAMEVLRMDPDIPDQEKRRALEIPDTFLALGRPADHASVDLLGIAAGDTALAAERDAALRPVRPAGEPSAIGESGQRPHRALRSAQPTNGTREDQP
jgi:site-specific recombinase XerD